MKTILITIHLSDLITRSDLVMRHILVDTIESREWADVVEETSSAEIIEIVLEVADGKDIEPDLKNLLSSLGHTQYTLEYILNEEDD